MPGVGVVRAVGRADAARAPATPWPSFRPAGITWGSPNFGPSARGWWVWWVGAWWWPPETMAPRTARQVSAMSESEVVVPFSVFFSFLFFWRERLINQL